MKNFCIIFLAFVIIIVTAVGVLGVAPDATPVPADYLRMHVRADSNGRNAQAVKYDVRDEIVAYLTPLVAGYETKEEAVEGISARLGEIAAIAEGVLAKKGFAYGASVSLRKETFPTRVYEGYVLPAGEYVALIVQLGSGQGDNWWCVVYPPLCFTAGNENVVYKSKIKEIIQRFYQK